MKAYRRKGGDIQAQELEAPATIAGKEYQVGDYLILSDGEVEGATKAEFEEHFELVKVKRTRGPNKPKAEKAAKPAKA